VRLCCTADGTLDEKGFPVTKDFLPAKLITCLLLVFGFQVATLDVAEAKEEAKAPLGTEWVRLKLDKNDKPVALEIAVVRYVPARMAKPFVNQPAGKLPNARQYVDLIGAVHVGDKKYYDELNLWFRQYQAMLYELVAPPGTRVERGRGTSNLHPVGALQNGVKSMLELEHQLEQVDYTQRNFVHADMSPEEFGQSMVDRDESFMQMYMRMAGQAIAEQSNDPSQGMMMNLELLEALTSEDKALKLKTIIAKQFEMMESTLSGMSGPEGSTLITERNKRALDVLRKQQRMGRRKLGIFYGAGHLNDMHDRLVKDFQMQPVGIMWMEAWDLRPKK
jgi:hypothetical protein